MITALILAHKGNPAILGDFHFLSKRIVIDSARIEGISPRNVIQLGLKAGESPARIHFLTGEDVVEGDRADGFDRRNFHNRVKDKDIIESVKLFFEVFN